jgi:hypothetical protein
MASAAPGRKHVALGYDGASASSSESGDGAVAAPAATVLFGDVAVLPEAGDNCGIARMVIPRGTRIKMSPGDPDAAAFSLDHAVLEGHRFAVVPIAPGTHLLSWGLTFGVATRPIFPGNYVANERVIKALRARKPPVTDLPATPNFDDLIVPHTLDEAGFVPAPQVPADESLPATFMGYPRPGGRRGVGTRNYIILVGTTSVTAGYVKALEARIKASGAAAGFPHVDGVVAVAHTEGGGQRDDGADASDAAPWRPHNYDLLRRTLAQFVVHPNVAAALVVDYRSQAETVWGSEVQVRQTTAQREARQQVSAVGTRGRDSGAAAWARDASRRHLSCSHVSPLLCARRRLLRRSTRRWTTCRTRL